jgi:hypothetical protein
METEVLHNFPCFYEEVRAVAETTLRPPIGPPKIVTVRNLYDMVDGQSPVDLIVTATPKPPTVKKVVREVVNFLSSI